MSYEAEIRWYDRHPYGSDIVCEETFPTLQEAVDYIERTGNYNCRAWINNKEVRLMNSRVADEKGEPVCTNPAWHELFAAPSQAILPKAPTVFRPQPTRGSAPTNPATLEAAGKLGDHTGDAV